MFKCNASCWPTVQYRAHWAKSCLTNSLVRINKCGRRIYRELRKMAVAEDLSVRQVLGTKSEKNKKKMVQAEKKQLFYNSSNFWNNFCLWVKGIFLPQKGNFLKTWISVHFFGNIYIIKACFLKKHL